MSPVRMMCRVQERSEPADGAAMDAGTSAGLVRPFSEPLANLGGRAITT
jgi:hypothetical protein